MEERQVTTDTTTTLNKTKTEKVPNQRLNEIAAREEVLFTSLALKDLGLMDDAAKSVPKDAIQNEAPRLIYGIALDHHARYGTLLTRQALESVLSATETPEKAACLQSQYDSIYAEYMKPKTGEYRMLKDHILARHVQRLAYISCRNGVERLLGATDGQQAIVDDLISEISAIKQAIPVDDGFEEYTLSALKAYVPDPDDSIAGDGWIRRGGSMLVTGSTGIGKSVIVEQLCVRLAGGMDFMGIAVPKPVKVLYVQSENDADTMKRDILSIVANVEPAVDEKIVDANLAIIHAYGMTGDALGEWLDAKCEKHRPDVLVMDNYQSFVDGDINSSETALNWKKPIDALAKRRRLGIIVVCHTNKPQDRKGWSARDSVYLAAGSAVLANWCRTSFELTQDGEDGRFRMRFGKNAERTGIRDSDGKIVRDIYVEHSGTMSEPWWRASDLQMPTSNGQYDMAIYNLRAGDPDMSMSEIATKAGCSKTTVFKVLQKFSASSFTKAVTANVAPADNSGTPAVHRSPFTLKGGERVNDMNVASGDSFSERPVNGVNDRVNDPKSNPLPAVCPTDDFLGVGDDWDGVASTGR